MAFAIDGMAEVIASGETGIIANAFSVDAFAAALTECIMDKATWLQMGSKARAMALRNYDICQVTQQYLNVYDWAMRRFQNRDRGMQA